MESKRRRCALCNSAMHEGGSFVVFHPNITVNINGCTELVRQADFTLNSFPKVFCGWDCFHRFFGAWLVDALPAYPTESQEDDYDRQFELYVEI